MTMKFRYNSLEDFLATNVLSVDYQLDDGGGLLFPVKGREIDATVLFADITGFSRRTLDFSSTETLIFVNHFFTWISVEALQGRPGIVDKYIGDEIMVVFSKEFGSDDPFVDAMKTARRMCGHDPWDFNPHIGIASGPVTVGFVGTPIKYNCSVFGAPVALAARCAAVKPQDGHDSGSRIIFTASEWGGRRLEDLFSPERYQGPDGRTVEMPPRWELTSSRKEPMKNIGEIEVCEVRRLTMWVPQGFSAEQVAKENLQQIRQAGRYWGSDKRPEPSHPTDPSSS